MAAIPVPVHFDGHNINIITEDSPSTCKNRTKGLNYGKKNNNKNKKRNNQNSKSKPQILNKRSPNSHSTSSNQNTNITKLKSPTTTNPTTNQPESSENQTVIITPISGQHNTSNISPSNKENIDELNPGQGQNPNPPISNSKKQSCRLPIVPPKKDNNANKLPTLPSLPLPPPVPSQIMNNPFIGSKKRPPTKQEIIAEQNRQLLATGLDPAEFGSHDDVGFDDDKNKNSNNGKDRQNLYKTELCREWSTSGWCYYNKRCSFAHGLQELRPVFRSKKWRTKRCRNWHTTGYCPYEHRCQFLHDQSPPRRISDYATANARALVAAQQRMQPLYFHYQVDCNRDETSDDDLDKKSNTQSNNGNDGKPNTPILKNTTTQTISSHDHPHTQSIGPRFNNKHSHSHGHHGHKMGGNGNRNNGGHKIIGNNNDHKTPKGSSNGSVNGNNNNIGIMNGNQMINKGQIRMIPQRKNNKKNKNKNKNNRNKQIKPKTPKGMNQNYQHLQIHQKSKKKKQKKDAVITPFNPVTNTYAGGVNINLNNINNMNGMSQHQSYEIAAQQLGLYNPAGIPSMSSSIAAAAAAMNGIIPPLPMTTMASTFQPLPPSIDPSLYLSLTPSPPQSPRNTNKEHHHNNTNNKKIKINGSNSNSNNNKLNVEVPVSLTPSPPSLPTVTPVHPIHSLNIGPTINNINNINGNAAALSHQQIGIELVKQQQTLAALHEKVQRVAQQQAAQQAEQNAAVQALLARNVLNKSNTPIAPIDGGLLESLLPTNDKPNNTNDKQISTNNNNDGNKSVPQIIKSSNNKSDNTTIQTQSVPNATNNNCNKKDNENENKSVTNTKTLPPIPPIPPPLQLQTSINSVVTGAVAAAMLNSTPNAILNKQTPNSINNTTFGFNNNNINVNVAVTPQTQMQTQKLSKLPPQQQIAIQNLSNTINTNTPTSTYVQQAHAHAHAYATQHSKINNVANQTNPIHAYSYAQPHAIANYPTQVPHVSAVHGHHGGHTINSLPQIQPLQPLSNLQPMQPIQTHIGYPPFYAPSPDFQEIPQQQYYNTNYTHHQIQRHQPY